MKRNCLSLLMVITAASAITAGLAFGDEHGNNGVKITTVASTVPSNGDVNPYGVAVVTRTTGTLTKGDILSRGN
jgi:hypothetical protein